MSYFMLKRISISVLIIVLGGAVGLFARAYHDKTSTEAAAAQTEKTWNAKPLCGGSDPAQTALESGGTCRPF